MMRRVILGNRFPFLLLHRAVRPFCTDRKPSGTERDIDVYRQLEKLDFMTAAKMLFSDPPKKKKFGLDFHLVQLFFACMPSLAVYLVAQYARYEIRKMEAEVEMKKKQAEEEEKAKEMDSDTMEEEPDSDLSKVKGRLDALEVAVKEIADETKKLSAGSIAKEQESSKKEQPTHAQSNAENNSKHGSSRAVKVHSRSEMDGSSQDKVKGSSPIFDALEDHKKQDKSK